MSPRAMGWTRGLLAPCFVAMLAACGTSSTEVLHTGTGGSGAGSSSATSGPSGSGGSKTTSTGSGGSKTTSAGTGGIADGGAPPCKRGMAYGYDSVADLTALSKGISWWYNWATAPDSAVATAHDGLGVEFVPMVWGQSFIPDLATQVPSDTHYLLGFNEPNFGSQANLTPTQAASLWPQVEAFAKSRKLALVSPAVNYCGSPCNVANPFDWLDQFFAACTGCQVDYIAVHWYNCTGSELTGYLQQFESKYTQPIWLTEFSCLEGSDTSEPAQEAYMKAALPLLEADPRVYRYAWFTGRSTNTPSLSLLGADGTLTPLGQIYVSSPEACKP